MWNVPAIFDAHIFCRWGSLNLYYQIYRLHTFLVNYVKLQIPLIMMMNSGRIRIKCLQGFPQGTSHRLDS